MKKMTNDEMVVDMLTRYTKVLDTIQYVKKFEYDICTHLLNLGIDKVPFDEMKHFETSVNDFISFLKTISELLKFEYKTTSPDFTSNLEYLCQRYLDKEKSTNKS